jgi:DNA-nicking Smr family endonuclease
MVLGASSRNEGVAMEIIELPIEDTLDLHSFPPSEVADLVEEYLYQAKIKGYREVRIIHGRGAGVQRRMVQSILKKHPDVISFQDASDRGSTSATLIATIDRCLFPCKLL